MSTSFRRPRHLHGIRFLHSAVRPSGRRLLSIFPEREMEVQGSVFAGLLCGSLRYGIPSSLTVPVQMALKTILEISGPMILLNAGGILIFISSFNNIFIRQDLESSRQLQRASDLSKRCLPLLVEGLHKGENMEELASVLLEGTDWAGVMVTDATSILGVEGQGGGYQPEDDAIPPVGKEALAAGVLLSEPGGPECRGLKAGTLGAAGLRSYRSVLWWWHARYRRRMMAAIWHRVSCAIIGVFRVGGSSILKCSRACSLKRMRVLKQALPVCHASWEAISIRVLSRSLVLKQGG